MGRITRAIVLGSALASTACVASLAPSAGLTASITLLLFTATLATGWRGRRIASWIAAAPVYLVPVLFLIAAGNEVYAYQATWAAGLIGLFLGTSRLGDWSLPTRLRWPIVTWAVVVAISWPVLAWRELDLTWPLVWDGRLPVAGARISGPMAVSWTAYTALTHLVGILWVDWLFYQWRHASWEQLRRDVITPMALCLLLACAIALYQGFFDIGFLSGHAWPVHNRATGTFVDANVLGMLAALWGPALLVLWLQKPSLASASRAIGALALAWGGVWMSGSRTAALTALVGVIIALPGVIRALPSRGLRVRVALGVSAAALGMVLAAAMAPSLTANALQRARYLIPEFSVESIQHTTSVLWRREGYGSAAVAMIREFPGFGVGLGSYNTLAHDFALESTGMNIPPDNAQNWFRHQLAEFGVLGSIGWIGFAAVFLVALVTPQREHRPESALRGPLLAFGLASLVGMPGQDAAVSVTFWLLVFWYTAGADVPVPGPTRFSALAWGLMWALAISYAAAGALTQELRPPFRAARFDFMHTRGFRHEPGFAWTAREAVTVEPASGRYLRVTVWVGHPDAVTRPVEANVWIDGAHVINRRLTRNTPVVITVRLAESRKRAVIRARVDRTFRPSDSGTSSDTRDLGLAMKWEFVERPPG